MLGLFLNVKKLMLWSNVYVYVYSYKNNFIINIVVEFIEKDDYYVLGMFMYVLKFEMVFLCYLIKKSWKYFDIMIKCFMW